MKEIKDAQIEELQQKIKKLEELDKIKTTILESNFSSVSAS